HEAIGPRLAKTPPIDAQKTPGIDTKPKPGTPPKPPSLGVPPQPAGREGKLALRFAGRDYAEVITTAEAAGGAEPPLTAEMWVRLNPARPRTYLMGNIAVSGTHPLAPKDMPAGWALSYAHNARVGGGAEQSSLQLQAGGKLYSGQR